MPQTLPETPRLDQLKTQARELQRAVRSGDATALRRVRAQHPRFASPETPLDDLRLADAQLVLAREYAFASWPRLQQYVAARDPALLQEAFETVKDGWISPADVPGDPAKLRSMLRRYPDLVHARIGKRGYTLLHFAAYRNYVAIAQILIAAGADVHALSPGGATPLAVAVTYPAPDIVRLLLPYGVRPDNLRMASGIGGLERVRRFFHPDGSLTAEAGREREGMAAAYDFADRPSSDRPEAILGEALMYAAGNGHIDIVEFLLDHGAEVNRVSFIGTALHWAALYNQREMAEALVAHGARVDILDDEFGGTAAGWADYYGNHDLRDWLRARETNA